MSRAAYACRSCRAPLGHVRTSGVFHPLPGVIPVFVDHRQGTTTLRCPLCGATSLYRGGRIQFAAVSML